jgi:hypothetical protein
MRLEIAARIGIGVAMVGALLTGVAVQASDYSDTCRSTDGQFVMDQGVLFQADAYRRGETGAQIQYRVLREKVHVQEEGYCVDWKRAGAKGFKFNFKKFTQMIEFQQDARSIRTEMRCVLDADGLPASYECDRRVVTLRIGAPELPEQGWGIEEPTDDTAVLTTWVHNGSEMQLYAQGEQRSFSYVKPRAGLEPYGVHRGSLLFDGTSDGLRLQGKARIFTKRCGELSFAVSGPIEADGNRIVLRGKSPRTNSGCRPVGWQEQELVFELKPGKSQ